MKSAKLLLVMLFSIAVAACGSGGGGATPEPGSTTGTITLLAGSASAESGNADGSRTVASFTAPYGVASDSAGNVYVADMYNNTIRKITPAGVVTTLAGSMAGTSGNADGIGTAAQFKTPFGVATDSTGNVYVADLGNNTIRKITPSGVVTTFANIYGWGVATDSTGNVYVVGSNTISKITPAGVVSTLAGSGLMGSADGTGTAARFINPRGVATDSASNVYVADTDNNTIRKITPAGVVTTFAGTAGTTGSLDSTGAAARFNEPYGVATDSAGNIYVADYSNHTIRKITPAGQVTTLAGTAGKAGKLDGSGAAAMFDHPIGIATDSTGNIFVTDYRGDTIRKITPAGTVTTLAGSGGSRGGTDGTGAAARFNVPMGVTTNSTGDVFVADYNNNVIRKISSAGVVSTLAGTAGVLGSADGTGAAASFAHPHGVAADSSGNVYVADNGNNTIRKISPAGVVSTLAGTTGVSGNTDGTGIAAQFSGPAGTATDSSGNIYVADARNFSIRKITPAGIVSTLAGSGTIGNADGNGIAASFTNPLGVATDSTGNVYVADAQAIRKITPAGVVSTLATGFSNPFGIATDSSGNVYVADNGNNTIRKITPAGVVSTAATGFISPQGVSLFGRTLFTTYNNAIVQVKHVP